MRRLRLIGYTRVSTEEQSESGLGLAAQRDAIERDAARRGAELVGVRQDASASGKSLDGRPELAAALAAIEAGEADGLVVAKLDRLSRSVRDLADLLERSRRNGWALVALDLGIDTTTPTGEAMASMVGVFAQLERRLASERTIAALAAARARGIRLGRPARLTAEVAATAWHMRARRRYTYERIAAELNRTGVSTADGNAWDRHAARYAARRGRDLTRTRARPPRSNSQDS